MNLLNNNEEVLVTADIETGGLNGRLDCGKMGMMYYPIFEIAIILTDGNLKTIGEPLHLIINCSEEDIQKSHEWSLTKHTETGLLDKVRTSTINLKQAEQLIIQYLKVNGIHKYDRATKKGGVMCGNSIMFDRSFMMAQMDSLHQHLHYRQLDVSVFDLAFRILGINCPTPLKKYSHEALGDVKETLAELGAYRDFLLKAQTAIENEQKVDYSKSIIHHCEVTQEQLSDIKSTFDCYNSNGSNDIIVNLGGYDEDGEEITMLVEMLGKAALEYYGDMVVFHE